MSGLFWVSALLFDSKTYRGNKMYSYRDGIKFSLTEHLRVKPNNKVVIITDSKSQQIANAFYNEAKKLAAEVQWYSMEGYSKGEQQKFPDEIMDQFQDTRKKIISLYLSNTGPEASYRYSLLNLGDPIAELLDDKSSAHIKHVSLPGITKKILREGCAVPRAQLKRGTDLIYRRLRKSQTVQIATLAGTELEIKLSKALGWRKEYKLDYGIWENLPLGEVYSSPIDCNGKLVIDCLVGGYEKFGFGHMKRYPLEFTIKNGEVTNMTCRKATHLVTELGEEVFENDDVSNIIGEIGFGTNFGIQRLIGNILQDEKFPGIHIAVGSSMPDCGEYWRSGVHVDMMMREPYVWVDNKCLMEEGKYVLRQ